MTIADVVRRAQAGDEAAFTELFHRYRPRIYWACLRMTKNQATAEDLTQDTFLCAFRKLKSFRGDAQFPTWLHCIATNLALMHFRKQSNRLETMPLECEMDGVTEEAPFLAQRDGDLEMVPERLALRSAVQKLPAYMQRVFVKRFVLGYDQNELARANGSPIGTSKNQIHRTRMKLIHALRRKMTLRP